MKKNCLKINIKDKFLLLFDNFFIIILVCEYLFFIFASKVRNKKDIYVKFIYFKCIYFNKT